jgi:hypothetical protein
VGHSEQAGRYEFLARAQTPAWANPGAVCGPVCPRARMGCVKNDDSENPLEKNALQRAPQRPI